MRVFKLKLLFQAALLLIILFSGGFAWSKNASTRNVCTLLLEQKAGHVVFEKGECDQRFSPASTFKIVLALLGYDSGFLIGPHDPTINYRPGVRAPKKHRKLVNPAVWLQDSVIWYSRELTRSLGEKRLGSYLRQLRYGNQDISGDAGRHNGLTNAWVSSSLQISPVEQVEFLRKALNGNLPFSARAVDFMKTVMPKYQAKDGHVVAGKTGSGWVVNKLGKRVSSKPIGWFVGWTQIGARKVVFARLEVGPDGDKGYLGPRVRQRFIEELPDMLLGSLKE